MRAGKRNILLTVLLMWLGISSFAQVNFSTCEIKYAWGTPFNVCRKEAKRDKKKVKIQDDNTITFREGDGYTSLEFMLGLSAVIHSQNFNNKPSGSAMLYFNALLKEINQLYGTPLIPQHQKGHIIMYRWGKQKPVVNLTYMIESEMIVLSIENY